MPAPTGHSAGLRDETTHATQSPARPRRTTRQRAKKAPRPLPPRTYADEHSGLQQITISRHPVFGRQLFLDGDLQVSDSDSAYGVAMTSPLLGQLPLGRVAILGGGDGGVLNELLRTLEPLGALPAELTLVEIDDRVMELCRKHLRGTCGDAFRSPHANIVVGDAFAWIDRARNLDAVIYDLTMDPVREDQPRGEFIARIIERTARALRPGGVLSMQCCGHGLRDERDRADRDEVLPLIRAAVDAHFESRTEQDVLVPSYRDLWTFLSARKAG
jgi:spermidine synthase/spermine synthase